MSEQLEFLGTAGVPQLYKVRQNGLLGIYHETKGLLVLGDWESIGDYRDSLAMVFNTNRDKQKIWGLIDEEGKLVTPCQWYYEEEPIYPELRQCSNGEFVNGYALVRNDLMGSDNDVYQILTQSGELIGYRYWSYFEELFDEEKNPIRVFSCNDNTGRFISVFEEDTYYPQAPAYWLNLVLDHIYEDGFYYLTYEGTVLTPNGAIHPYGNTELPKGWFNIPKFSGSYVSINGNLHLNRSGQFCISDPEDDGAVWWDEIFYSEHNMIFVRAGSCWGALNAQKEFITPVQWDEITQEKNKILKVKKAGKYGLLSLEGRELIPCLWEQVIFETPNLLKVERDGKYGLFSLSGEELVPCQMDALVIPRGSDRFILAKANGLWGAYDFQGRQVISFQWKDIDYFPLGYRVYRDGLYGLLDRQGNEMFPCQWEAMVGDFHMSHYIKVMQGGLWGLLDSSGMQITPCQWRCIEFPPRGHFRVKKGGKWGMLDKSGQLVCPLQWDECHPICQNVWVKANGFYGLIDGFGTILQPCQWEKLRAGKEILMVRQNGKWGSVNHEGKTIVPCQWDDIDLTWGYGIGKTIYIVRKGNEFFELDLQGNPIK